MRPCEQCQIQARNPPIQNQMDRWESSRSTEIPLVRLLTGGPPHRLRARTPSAVSHRR